MLRMKRHPRPSDPATAPCGGTVAPGGRFRRQPSPSSYRPADAASLAMVRGGALAAASSNEYFRGAIVVSGVDPSYGGHFADPATPAYADIVAFVEGND